MLILSLWISGTTRTGKTSLLVAKFCQWVRKHSLEPRPKSPGFNSAGKLTSAVLVFAANNNNRRQLNDRLSLSVEGTYPVICKTPVGFIADEVMLFFPLLFKKLNLKAQFPLRLRPETEQELATRLWRNESDWEILCAVDNEYRLVRQTLDLLQLAGASCIPTEDISYILQEGLGSEEVDSETSDGAAYPLGNHLWSRMGELLLIWRKWCLDRGLLSYGLIYDLYWRYLLPNSEYQHHLIRRYQAVFADDLDDYPAIARDLFELLLDRGVAGVFTYNPDGKIRLGLNADPDYLEGLASRCEIEVLAPTKDNLAVDLAATAIELVTENAYLVNLPAAIQSLQTISRAELLRQTAEIIIAAVQRKEIQPQEIAIIAPGLDEIARYTLMEILSAAGVEIEPLNEQRPLISSPLVRTLLTLLALVYQDLGRLVDRDAIAEMLTILSQQPKGGKLVPLIDPVRAGLIADYCYHANPQQPYLSPVEEFPRWDRLGHEATAVYQAIIEWIEEIKTKQQAQAFLTKSEAAPSFQGGVSLTPTIILDRAIAKFMGHGTYFSSDCAPRRGIQGAETSSARSPSTGKANRLAILRELMETAQHFWEVDRRLRQNEPSFQSQSATVAQFIQLLRRGTISANPRPLGQFQTKSGAVTLATIFQYRSLRTTHRWQFWLDAGSPLWQQGGAATLFAAPLFLQKWSGKAWMPEDEYEMDRQRLQRIIRDVLARAEEKIFLCHSDLGVNGTEQMGALLPLVQAALQYKLKV